MPHLEARTKPGLRTLLHLAMSVPEAANALECRTKAIEAMERAATHNDPLLRAWWLSIAKSWHDIAEHIERLRHFGI